MHQTILFSLFFLSCAPVALCQKYMDTNNPKEVKSLLSKDNEIKGFGGLDVKVGHVNCQRSLLLGGYGGMIINRNYIFGIAGYGLATENKFEAVPPGNTEEKQLHLYGGYGGLMIGGIIAPKEVIHVSMPIVLAAGNMEVSDENYFNNGLDTDFVVDKSVFFVVEPGLRLEVNITKGLKLAMGASYRLVRGSDLLRIDDDGLTGYTATFSLSFGRF